MSILDILTDKIKSLFEKIKSLDKKVLIGAGAGIVALIVAIVVILVVCLGGKDTNNDKDDTDTKDKIEKEEDNEDESEDESEEEEATFTVKVVDGDGNAVAGVVVQVSKDEDLTATSDDTGVATFALEITEGCKLSVVSCPDGYEYTGDAEVALEAGIKEYELKIQKKAEETSTNTTTQQPTTTKQDGTEILGAGSKDQPYLETPNLSNMTLTTVSIPAGKALYYGIYRVGNMILTINDASAYVIESDGTRHNASGGKVTFTVESAMASDYVLFQIGNTSSSAKSFTIKFTNQTGSYMNPTIINTIGSDVKISLAEGNEVGHYYKYIAEKTGTIRFYMTATTDSAMYVTNNANSAQRTFEADEDVKTDDQGRQYIELEVTQGNEIIIQVGAKPNNRGKYTATTITWSGKFN